MSKIKNVMLANLDVLLSGLGLVSFDSEGIAEVGDEALHAELLTLANFEEVPVEVVEEEVKTPVEEVKTPVEEVKTPVEEVKTPVEETPAKVEAKPATAPKKK